MTIYYLIFEYFINYQIFHKIFKIAREVEYNGIKYLLIWKYLIHFNQIELTR